MDFLRRQFTVRHHEAGPDGTLRTASLFDMFQDAAAEHAQTLGCGMEFLRTQSFLWVLSRIALEIRRMPAIGETVTVETYPTGVERLFALRQFTVTDAAGNVIARATSGWLLLSAETGRPQRIEKTLGAPLPLNEDRPRHFAVPDRAEPVRDASAELRYAIRASQIDVNGHLNNAYYAAFVHDMLAELSGENRPPASLQIFFQHAGPQGAQIVCRGETADGQFRIEGRSPDGETLYFQACGRR